MWIIKTTDFLILSNNRIKKYCVNTFSGSIILAKSTSNNANGIVSYSAKITETISIIKFFN